MCREPICTGRWCPLTRPSRAAGAEPLPVRHCHVPGARQEHCQHSDACLPGVCSSASERQLRSGPGHGHSFENLHRRSPHEPNRLRCSPASLPHPGGAETRLCPVPIFREAWPMKPPRRSMPGLTSALRPAGASCNRKPARARFHSPLWRREGVCRGEFTGPANLYLEQL